MSFKKILCPTDFSPGAESALRMAVRLAADSGAELVLAHAWYIPPAAYTVEAPFPPFLIQQIVDDAQRGLDEVVQRATVASAQHTSGRLLNGVPWAQIVGELEEQAFDLCVIGTHGRTGLSRILLGSIAEKVLRHAPCSVLAVRPDGDVQTFSHVLIPTDFSREAEHALELAPTLVAPGGTITLMHVVEVPVAYAGEVTVEGFAAQVDKRAAAALEKAASRLRTRTSAPVTTRSRIGYPGAQTIAALDADRSIDLVAMGSHGRTGINRVLLGSVAEKVVRHAHCPVLVARKRT
jgi:nucleotide-binding universal stress UspA family protein